MSTTIYNAYRFPLNKITGFKNFTERRCRVVMADAAVQKYVKVLGTNTNTLTSAFKVIETQGDDHFRDTVKIFRERINDADDVLSKEMVEHIYADTISMFYLSTHKLKTVMWYGYVLEGMAYVVMKRIDSVDMSSIAAQMKPSTLPYVESYNYWTNTDWPDDVSREKWEKRGDNWDACLDSVNGYRYGDCAFRVFSFDDSMNVYHQLKRDILERKNEWRYLKRS